MNLNDQVCNDKTLIMEHTISDLKIRLKKWYPDEINAFENAKSDEEIIDLQKKFVSQAKEKLILELQKTNTDSKILSALRSTDETLAAIITEQLYQTLCNARNEQIQTELVKLFDEVERLKNMGSQDIEVLTYAMINGGLVALGIGMATDLILNLLAGLGLGEAIFTALTTLGMSGFGIMVDIVILAIIPIFYFSVKISIPLENTGVSSVFAASVWPFSLIFSLARRNEGNFFQAVPTTLSRSLAEVRLASLVAWA